MTDIDVIKIVSGLRELNQYPTDKKDILKISDNDGTTVAHIQAFLGHNTEDKDILALATKTGWTVDDEQMERRNTCSS